MLSKLPGIQSRPSCELTMQKNRLVESTYGIAQGSGPYKLVSHDCLYNLNFGSEL